MRTFLLFTLFIIFSILPVFSQTILYEEYFTGGNFDNIWDAGFNATGGGKSLSIMNMPGNPSGDGWVGYISTFRAADSAGIASSWSGDTTWTDYEVEANLYIPATGGSPFSFAEYYALEFRVDTNDVLGNTAGYQFQATFNSNAATGQMMRFRKRPSENSGSPVTIHQWDAADIPGGAPTTDGWHNFKVKAEGNQFWFYFNGLEMPGNPFSDTTSTALLTHGPIGVYAFKMNFFGNPLDTTVIYVDDVIVNSLVSGIDGNEIDIPSEFSLSQNYPNPFNPSTTIEFSLKEADNVKLAIFNSSGELINTLTNNQYSAGTHQLKWNATDESGARVSAGVYLYTLQTSERSETRKMILLK